MKDLANEADLEHSRKLGDRSTSDDFIKLDEGATFVVIVATTYTEAFEHWVRMGKTRNQSRRAVCLGGLEGGGFAVDDCPLCARANEHYTKKHELLESGDKDQAAVENKRGNEVRASLRAYYVAVKGDVLHEREKNPKTGKVRKVVKPDFESEDVDLTPRILALTKAQNDKLIGLKYDDNVPEITVGADLVGRILEFRKEKKDNQRYAGIVAVIPHDEIDIDLEGVDLPNLDEQTAKLDDDALAQLLSKYYYDSEDGVEERDDDIRGSGKDDVDTTLTDDDFEEEVEEKAAKPPAKKRAKRAAKEEPEEEEAEEEEASDDDAFGDEEPTPPKRTKPAAKATSGKARARVRK